MGVALENRAAGFQRDLEQGVGDLAEAAAGRGDHAAFLQHAAGDEATGATRIAELLPEAEDFAGRNHQPVEMLRSAAEVLDLAELETGFALPRIGPERRHRFRQQDRESFTLLLRELRKRVENVADAALDPQASRLRCKD
jgi:hypothetical protein